MIKVKPAKEGLVVRCPETKRPLPPEGKRVNWSSYWTRRKLAGEIVLVSDEPVKKDKPAKKKKEEVETFLNQEIES